LGTHTTLKENEHVHHCPFCNHHKKKLNINLENQKWHCWVCDSKGQSIPYLLKKLKVGKHILTFVNKVYNSEYYVPSSKEEQVEQIYLPKEFQTLSKEPSGFNPSYNHAKKYLKERGISNEDIIKHNIGFCSEGTYNGRIIIPSYDCDGKLNYFIARTFYEDESYKYKNPTVSRDIIPFGNLINWNEPLVIVEGAFDAITVKRNGIPILGKVIPKKLMREIFIRDVKKIYMMLDEDAQRQSLYYVDYFTKQGIECINIQPSDKDANQMGFSRVLEILKETKKTNFVDIILQKMNLI
jgi:DNA primase